MITKKTDEITHDHLHLPALPVHEPPATNNIMTYWQHWVVYLEVEATLLIKKVIFILQLLTFKSLLSFLMLTDNNDEMRGWNDDNSC